MRGKMGRFGKENAALRDYRGGTSCLIASLWGKCLIKGSRNIIIRSFQSHFITCHYRILANEKWS